MATITEIRDWLISHGQWSPTAGITGDLLQIYGDAAHNKVSGAQLDEAMYLTPGTADAYIAQQGWPPLSVYIYGAAAAPPPPQPVYTAAPPPQPTYVQPSVTVAAPSPIPIAPAPVAPAPRPPAPVVVTAINPQPAVQTLQPAIEPFPEVQATGIPKVALIAAAAALAFVALRR